MNPKINKSLIVAVAILVVGVIAFASIVKADDVNTSVTVANASPSISNLSLNYGNAITLSEGTFIPATTTLTVTDTNGCNTLNYVRAQIYLASSSNSTTTSTCNSGSQNDNNCYIDTFFPCTATTTVGQNTCTGAGDPSAQYECGFKVWYIAEGTDATGDWASSIWSAIATSSDGIATTTATNTGEAIEINGLRAIDAGPAIAYGSLGILQTSAHSTTSATTTGNVIIDISLQASNDMCDDYPGCTGDYILSTQQEYSLTTGFSYGAGTDLASSSATNVNTTLANPSSTTTVEVDFIEWLIQIPSGTVNDSYTGVNIFTAIAPI